MEKRVAKWWLHSRLIWLNLIALAVATAADHVSILERALPANYYAIVAFVLPIANVCIRLLTTQPLSLTASPPPEQNP